MLIPVYLSHATPHKKEQEYLKDALIKKLSEYGMEAVAIEAFNIRTNDSIGAIKKKMKGCYGLIALAYGRRTIISGINKYDADLPGTASGLITDLLETTPYIQIEASIASAYELPVLVLKEKNLIEEGVLEQYCIGISGPYFSFTADDSGSSKKAIDEYLESRDFIKSLEEFKKEVAQKYTDQHMFY